MLVKIPGREEVDIKNAVFDYNGTIALNGKISPSVRARLIELSKIMPVYVLTADTNNSAKSQCADLPLSLKILFNNKDSTQKQKADTVLQIGAKNCICFGNGFNDIEMFKQSGLSVAILGDEGVCGGLLCHSDIVVKSIEDGIDLLFNTNRIAATLRN